MRTSCKILTLIGVVVSEFGSRKAVNAHGIFTNLFYGGP
jgi:hypothetical protein